MKLVPFLWTSMNNVSDSETFGASAFILTYLSKILESQTNERKAIMVWNVARLWKCDEKSKRIYFATQKWLKCSESLFKRNSRYNGIFQVQLCYTNIHFKYHKSQFCMKISFTMSSKMKQRSLGPGDHSTWTQVKSNI